MKQVDSQQSTVEGEKMRMQTDRGLGFANLDWQLSTVSCS